MKKVDTSNELQCFDIDVYAQEFAGKSTSESKLMCDMLENMPPWMAEEIDQSFEVLAVRNKGAAPEPAPASGGLADLAKDDTKGDFDDDIPF